MKLNERITDARRKAGMTQTELGDRMDVSRQTVSKWETGESNPEISRLPALAKILGVSTDWLLGDEEQNGNTEGTYTGTAGNRRVYPEWLDRLPSVVMTPAKRYGWLAGIYMLLAGILCTGLALFSRKTAYRMMFPLGTDDPLYESRLQAWQGFSTLTGIVLVIGIVIMVLGAVLAVGLFRWGRKQPVCTE